MGIRVKMSPWYHRKRQLRCKDILNSKVSNRTYIQFLQHNIGLLNKLLHIICILHIWRPEICYKISFDIEMLWYDSPCCLWPSWFFRSPNAKIMEIVEHKMSQEFLRIVDIDGDTYEFESVLIEVFSKDIRGCWLQNTFPIFLLKRPIYVLFLCKTFQRRR